MQHALSADGHMSYGCASDSGFSHPMSQLPLLTNSQMVLTNSIEFAQLCCLLNSLIHTSRLYHSFFFPCFFSCLLFSFNGCEFFTQADHDIPLEQHALIPSFMGTAAGGKRNHPILSSDHVLLGKYLTPHEIHMPQINHLTLTLTHLGYSSSIC